MPRPDRPALLTVLGSTDSKVLGLGMEKRASDNIAELSRTKVGEVWGEEIPTPPDTSQPPSRLDPPVNQPSTQRKTDLGGEKERQTPGRRKIFGWQRHPKKHAITPAQRPECTSGPGGM